MNTKIWGIWNASYNGNTEKLRELLVGADQRDIDGGDIDVYIQSETILIWNPLSIASGVGHHACVELLIKAGANVNYNSRDYKTPLYWATFYNHPSIVTILIEAGARIDHIHEHDFNPLTCAAFNNYTTVVKLLLEGGANREIKTNEGVTALDIARRQNNVDVVEILMEYEHRELVIRPLLVDYLSCGCGFPVEIAELCGDFVVMTPARRTSFSRMIRFR